MSILFRVAVIGTVNREANRLWQEKLISRLGVMRNDELSRCHK